MPCSKWKIRTAGFLFGFLCAGLLLSVSLWVPRVDRMSAVTKLFEERCLPFSVAAIPPKASDLLAISGPPPGQSYHDINSELTLIASRRSCTVADIFQPLSESERTVAIEASVQLALNSLEGAESEEIWPDEETTGFLQLVAVLEDRNRHPAFVGVRFGSMEEDEMNANATRFNFSRPTESGTDA